MDYLKELFKSLQGGERFMTKGIIKLESLIKHFNLTNVNNETSSFVNVLGLYRPGLELVGYYEYVEEHKAVILGNKEINFISSLNEEKRNEVYEFLTNETIPFILISEGIICPNELLNLASKKHCLLLSSEKTSQELLDGISVYIYEKLAPSKKIHGTLLDVYGIGVLLVGESGIGKSEIALELVKKGHRLVADDSVIVSAANRKLYGKAPSPLKGFLEVRGLGIINVIQMFGVVSIRNSKHISLIISLEKAENVKSIDRLLNKVDSKNLLGLDIPLVRLPVSEGRSMSYLVEVATINYRMKQNGYDATKEFARLYDEVVEGEENHD